MVRGGGYASARAACKLVILQRERFSARAVMRHDDPPN